ncbi:MAG: hypothetical protein ACTHUU_12500, partial [Brachybacterium sp.]
MFGGGLGLSGLRGGGLDVLLLFLLRALLLLGSGSRIGIGGGVLLGGRLLLMLVDGLVGVGVRLGISISLMICILVRHRLG